MTKRLYRGNDRILGGVCSGIAEYLDFDPVAVRLAYGHSTGYAGGGIRQPTGFR